MINQADVIRTFIAETSQEKGTVSGLMALSALSIIEETIEEGRTTKDVHDKLGLFIDVFDEVIFEDHDAETKAHFFDRALDAYIELRASLGKQAVQNLRAVFEKTCCPVCFSDDITRTCRRCGNLLAAGLLSAGTPITGPIIDTVEIVKDEFQPSDVNNEQCFDSDCSNKE